MSSRSPGNKDSFELDDLPEDPSTLRRFDEKQIKDLPDLPSVRITPKAKGIDTARICPTCKQEARVVANNLGVRAYCGPCKTDWPITLTPMGPSLPLSMGRGMSKQTLVEPDWSLAWADLDDDDKFKRSTDD